MNRLKELQRRIAHLATLYRPRNTDQVRLIAVSKGQSAARVESLAAQGQTEFAESYLPEINFKAKELPNLKWIFIGRIQSNKIGKILGLVSEMQSVGTLPHAEKLAREVSKAGREPFPVFLLANSAEEPQKAGFPLSDIAKAARVVQSFPELRIRGIMAIPPVTYSDITASRDAEGLLIVPQLYQHLRRIADEIGDGKLSLGMSADMELALAAGSDCLRIGEALMGPRQT